MILRTLKHKWKSTWNINDWYRDTNRLDPHLIHINGEVCELWEEPLKHATYSSVVLWNQVSRSDNGWALWLRCSMSMLWTIKQNCAAISNYFTKHVLLSSKVFWIVLLHGAHCLYLFLCLKIDKTGFEMSTMQSFVAVIGVLDWAFVAMASWAN